jgi:hypothetical protein
MVIRSAMTLRFSLFVLSPLGADRRPMNHTP